MQFPHPPVTSSIYGPNILLSLQSSLNVRDQVSNQYRTNGEIMVLHILMFTFLDSSREFKRSWTGSFNIELERSSLPCSQKPATENYPGPHKFSHSSTVFKIKFYVSSHPMATSLHVFEQIACRHSSLINSFVLW
jgi:hypothetical protein